MTRIAAARFGAIEVPSRPMAMVGKPTPITPLTKPAKTKTRATTINSIVLRFIIY
jgi:hypothetical protein